MDEYPEGRHGNLELNAPVLARQSPQADQQQTAGIESHCADAAKPVLTTGPMDLVGGDGAVGQHCPVAPQLGPPPFLDRSANAVTTSGES